VLNHHRNRTFHEQYKLPDINYFSFSTGHFSLKSKPWLITTIEDQIIVGKARRRITPTGLVLITHWQCSFFPQFTKLYPTQPINFSICSGCSYNSNLISNRCTIFIPINLASRFFCTYNSQEKTIKPYTNHLDLIYSIAIRHPLHIPPTPSISYNSASIPPIFEPGSLTNTLQTIANSNIQLSEITFYTDGSVRDFGTQDCSMGIGWVQIHQNNILHEFQAQIKYWPCSFKAELFAILSAISTAPRSCIIHIFTDSQSVISKFNSLQNSPCSLSFTHTPYSMLWYTLINLTQSYNHQIIFHKVTAHQEDRFNNHADQLARCHLTSDFLIFKPYNIYNPNYSLQLYQYPLELPTRRTIRTICYSHIYALWSSQHRFQQWSHIAAHINWSATWRYINNNQKILNYSHSF
jgi:ribonuclease HI